MDPYRQTIHWYFVMGMSLLSFGIIFSGFAFWYYYAIFALIEQNMRRQIINQKIIDAIEKKYCSDAAHASDRIQRYCASLQ